MKFDTEKYEVFFVITTKGYILVLEQERNTDTSNKWTKQDLLDHKFEVFDSYDALIEGASQKFDFPVEHFLDTHITFRQENGEWGEVGQGGILWHVSVSISDNKLGDITTLQYIAQFEC